MQIFQNENVQENLLPEKNKVHNKWNDTLETRKTSSREGEEY